MPSVRGFMNSSRGVAVAMIVMNVGTYGFQMLAASRLEPASFGAVGSVLNFLLVVVVIELAFQATAARRIAAAPEHVASIERVVLRVSARVSLATGVVMLLASPLIDRLLNLGSLPTALLVAVSTIPMTAIGAYAGILQGERRWEPLCWFFMANGIPRVVVGVVLLLLHPSVLMAVLALTLSWGFPLGVGIFALRHRRVDETALPAHSTWEILKESAHNGQALLAVFVLSNVDLIVARNVLTSHDSGLYAAGLIVAKAVLFLPQFAVVVAFPTMSHGAGHRKALLGTVALILGTGAACTLGTWLLSGLALVFTGGQRYAVVQHTLWQFAVLGACLALLQVLVYAAIARRVRLSIYLVWLAAALVVTLGLTRVDTRDGLLHLVIVVDVVLSVVLLVLAVASSAEPTPVDPALPEPAPAA